MDNRHAHSALIDVVGAEAVMARFGLSHQALHNWRLRGIPVLKRRAFKELAESKHKGVPADFLEVWAA